MQVKITKYKEDKFQVVKSVYKICPDCGNFILYSNKEKFCSVCGKELICKCPNCLEPIIYPVSKFCPVCGTKLNRSE
jgi:predicted amidophosphoribosyltransferase